MGKFKKQTFDTFDELIKLIADVATACIREFWVKLVGEMLYNQAILLEAKNQKINDTRKAYVCITKIDNVNFAPCSISIFSFQLNIEISTAPSFPQ